MVQKMLSYVSYENEAIFVAALACLFYGAVILGIL